MSDYPKQDALAKRMLDFTAGDLWDDELIVGAMEETGFTERIVLMAYARRFMRHYCAMVWERNMIEQ